MIVTAEMNFFYVYIYILKDLELYSVTSWSVKYCHKASLQGGTKSQQKIHTYAAHCKRVIVDEFLALALCCMRT